MALESNNLVCPGCGAPLGAGYKNCDSCGRPVVITSFKSAYDLNPMQANKYQQSYKKMLASDPDNPQVKTAFAMTLLRMGLYDQAIKAFDEAMLLDLDNYETFMYAAIARMRGKRPAFAPRKEIDKMLECLESSLYVAETGSQYYLMSLIKYDYFDRKGFRTSPTSDECMEKADFFGISDADIMMLNDVMKFDSTKLPPVG